MQVALTRHLRRSAKISFEQLRRSLLSGSVEAIGRWLLENTPIREADYFICGPTAFLQCFVTGLRGAGVAQDRIHYEYFGPGADLMAA